MPVQSTEEEESRGRRGSLPPLCIKHVPRGREVDGVRRSGELDREGGGGGKKRAEENEIKRTNERERAREKQDERIKERERERERGRKGERKPTRLGGYVRIIILRYSHIYKSAI